jgi:hypothetical protein
MDVPGLDRVAAVVRSHMQAERQAGFPRLTRIPAASVIRWLDYFGTLDDAAGQALLDSMATLAAMRFYPPSVIQEHARHSIDPDASLIACRDAMRSPQFSMGLRYEGIRMRKAMMSDPMSVRMMTNTRATLDFTPRDDMPPELVPDPDPANLKPAKAPLFRKLINAEFKANLPEKRTLPGGEIIYDGLIEGTPTTLRVLFGGMGMQMRYSVSAGSPSEDCRLMLAAYEDFWMAAGGWDYITEENAEASIHLLADLVRDLVRLRNEVVTR